MKRSITLLAVLLLLILLLPACGSAIVEKTTAPAETKAETSEPAPTVETAPAPVTTEEEKPDDPADDGILKILMIGNSFCYYYVDELYGMLKAVGTEAEVWNLYYSGCKVDQHWNWYLEDQANYQLFKTSKNGRQEYPGSTLKGALAKQNWDVISLQQHFTPAGTATYEGALKGCTPYVEKLCGMIRKARPLAAFYWHETWGYQVGYDRNGYHVANKEEQTHQYEMIRDVSEKLCEDNDLPMIPSGDAWQRARQDPAVGDTLCDRKKDGGDNYHDGDFGGGQYLNASVWFEVITGQSILGNTYRPTSYSLSEAKIAALQKAAHTAVAECSATGE